MPPITGRFTPAGIGSRLALRRALGPFWRPWQGQACSQRFQVGLPLLDGKTTSWPASALSASAGSRILGSSKPMNVHQRHLGALAPRLPEIP